MTIFSPRPGIFLIRLADGRSFGRWATEADARAAYATEPRFARA